MPNSQKIKHAHFKLDAMARHESVLPFIYGRLHGFDVFHVECFVCRLQNFYNSNLRTGFIYENFCLNFSSDQKETSEIQASETCLRDFVGAILRLSLQDS